MQCEERNSKIITINHPGMWGHTLEGSCRFILINFLFPNMVVVVFFGLSCWANKQSTCMSAGLSLWFFILCSVLPRDGSTEFFPGCVLIFPCCGDLGWIDLFSALNICYLLYKFVLKPFVIVLTWIICFNDILVNFLLY